MGVNDVRPELPQNGNHLHKSREVLDRTHFTHQFFDETGIEIQSFLIQDSAGTGYQKSLEFFPWKIPAGEESILLGSPQFQFRYDMRDFHSLYFIKSQVNSYTHHLTLTALGLSI